MIDVVVTLGNGIPTSLADWLNNFQKMAHGTGYLWMAHDAKKFADKLISAEYEPLYTHPPLSEGEDSAEAFARIVAARKAYVDAAETYNTRLSLVNSERAKGNWSMRVDDEARAMWDAQSAFIKAAQDETDAALAATRSGSATTVGNIKLGSNSVDGREDRNAVVNSATTSTGGDHD